MGPRGSAYWRRVFYSEWLEKKNQPKRKHLKKSEEENPAMDEAEINRLVQNALEQAGARADQKRKKSNSRVGG